MSKSNFTKSDIDLSCKIVFFGGAGISTESGIPDFRSQDGLYNLQYKFPPETIISHSFFYQNPSEFYKFYRDKIIFENIKPNPAHIWLAKNNIPIITQNIDNLHQEAGSQEVYELHGSINRNYCTKCHEFYDLKSITKLIDNTNDHIPLCEKCDSIIKPDVVLYEEPLNDKIWKNAQNKMMDAEILIIGGTSLVVYPAASMIRYFYGKQIIVINKTPLNVTSNSVKIIEINKPIGKFFA